MLHRITCLGRHHPKPREAAPRAAKLRELAMVVSNSIAMRSYFDYPLTRKTSPISIDQSGSAQRNVGKRVPSLSITDR